MSWLRRLFSHGRLERELDRELRFHFEHAVADAMRAGMSEAAARRATRLEWGGVEQIKEECREARGAAWLTDSLADLRVAWRGVRKNPGFAAAAVGALALGIGGNTAIFSVVNAAFLRPLPYRDVARLVSATERFNDKLAPTVPPPEIAAWARTGIFEALAGNDWGNPRRDIAAPGRAPDPSVYTRVTTNFFATLGVTPQLGRDFLPDECDPGRSRVALVSDQLWRSSFGANAAAIGATVLVDSAPYTVVGVLPRGFAFPGADPPDVITPVPTCPAGMATQRGGWLSVIGRLRPGATVQQAQARLEAATRQLNAVHPGVFEYSQMRNPRDPHWVAVMRAARAFLRRLPRLARRDDGRGRLHAAHRLRQRSEPVPARAMTREREVAVRRPSAPRARACCGCC